MADNTNLLDDIWSKRGEIILETVGKDTPGLPVPLWKPGMFLKNMPNRWWQQQTEVFPAKANPHGTHPLYVLTAQATGCRVCPCSSKGHKGLYIKQGCRLEKTGKRVDRDSYVLTKLAFPVPRSLHISPKPRLWGIVPKGCLAGRQP
jgi:hypothetical protein